MTPLQYYLTSSMLMHDVIKQVLALEKIIDSEIGGNFDPFLRGLQKAMIARLHMATSIQYSIHGDGKI